MNDIERTEGDGEPRGGEWSVLLIGDVHAKLGRFARILSAIQPERSIQLGDLGMRKEHQWFLDNLDPDRHRVLFGNHDFMPFLNKPHSLGDWSFPFPGVMAIRGADSIDRRFRSTGLTWWPNEQLSHDRMRQCIEVYRRTFLEADVVLLVLDVNLHLIHKSHFFQGFLHRPGTHGAGKPAGL